MKLVFLDAKTIGDDLDLSQFDQFGEVVKYSFSTPEEVPGRVLDADVIIVNKILINEASIGTAKKLKLVCVTATGTNNLDKEYLANVALHGGMLPDTLRNRLHSTPLPCCFIFWNI